MKKLVRILILMSMLVLLFTVSVGVAFANPEIAQAGDQDVDKANLVTADGAGDRGLDRSTVRSGAKNMHGNLQYQASSPVSGEHH